MPLSDQELLFKEDFFERIINVKWSVGGGVFVLGISHVSTAKASIYGGAYGYVNAGNVGKQGTPVFVLCGQLGHEIADTAGAIWASNDGRTWTRVYVTTSLTTDNDTTIDSIVAVTWDPKAKTFYAELNHYHSFTAPFPDLTRTEDAAHVL